MQGWRNTMEDSHIAEVDLGNGVSFFGVYDGHGGTSQHSLRTHSYYVGHEVA
jgi:serine/threonine protein phosphatase PrpC